jgi:hypothetical protein
MTLALDTAFSTFVPTDRLDAMRRSAMARSFSWDLSAACYSPRIARRCRPRALHSAASLPALMILVDEIASTAHGTIGRWR